MPEILKRRPVSISLGLLLFAAVVIADYVTTEEVGFSVFYFLPIFLFAWYISIFSSAVIAVASALVWPVIHVVAGDPFIFHPYWDAIVKLASYVIFLVALSALKKGLQRERTINEQLTKALVEVKELRGLLPICSSCKKIRDEQGHWNVLEAYIQEHSDAAFTHSLCPECAHRLYPEFSKSKSAGPSGAGETS